MEDQKKLKRQIIDFIWKYATDKQVDQVAVVLGIKSENEKFDAKVSANNQLYHRWRRVQHGLYAAICNPGLLRGNDDLFPLTGGERLCKTCSIHL